MSQRQLALQSGVNHSTISRLIKGDRVPSLGTVTKLTRALRAGEDEVDGPAFFESANWRPLLPTTRVEYALRGDECLTEADVRDLMQAYITRRIRAAHNGSPNWPDGSSNSTGSSETPLVVGTPAAA